MEHLCRIFNDGCRQLQRPGAGRLDQAGVPYVVLEKNDEVGGTWFENRYPGCRVDVPNHLYSYSFLQRTDWPQRFTPQ